MSRAAHDRLIGLVPAAGRATRLGLLPCSKELFPIGFVRAPDGTIRPKVVSHYLLEKMRAAGTRDALIVLRPGKWDVAEYYKDGASIDMNLAYLLAEEPLGPPFTLDHAYPFVRDATVLFGFPDILFEPMNAFAAATARLDVTGADLVVGTFPPHPHELFDIVDAGEDGRVRRLDVAPGAEVPRGIEQRAWVFAVWRPAFTEFLHDEVGRLRAVAASGAAGARPEWPVASAIAAAVDAGLHVNSVYFPDAAYTDVGKPERLEAAIYRSHLIDLIDPR
jgi:glucose-1-phosphate thymidylyltransferase